MADLKPCPFCGNAEDIEMQEVQADHYIQCLECEASTSCVGSRPEARELWNRRAAARADGGVDKQLRTAGTLLSNIAFNLAQDERLPEEIRAAIDFARRGWDTAVRADGEG
ncbi:Lar family restriction alleviation protein [Luteimonas sp. TWI662]|uniref:Lar family restriction alleviation protein n=1 Tax=Luteimonas sp. TWI662 TaxID=3136789 RepID=UPI003208232F